MLPVRYANIVFRVEGMEAVAPEKKEISVAEDKKESKSINGTIHTVEFVDPYKFRIGDTLKFGKYVRNGVAKQVKLPKDLAFKELKDVYYSESVLHDANLTVLDFAKTEQISLTHIVFEALDSFEANNARAPSMLPQYKRAILAEWNVKDCEELLGLAKKVAERYGKKTLAAGEEDFVKKCAYTAKAAFGPLCAFIGGLVAQETVKAITAKYTPINQIMYYNCMELVPTIDAKSGENALKQLDLEGVEDRYTGVKMLLGGEAFARLANSKIFMVGVGAIGCELLKNYAMLGVSSGDGKILITDPDVIEVSNLNRQFLFKEKHLRKPKSTTAAASVMQMNPTLKGKIVARTDKVYDGTAYIFTDQFFGELSAVTNALDNVQARRYIDSRCVTNKKPLLESGTLGAKGHVQVIVPYKTESYSSQNDPEESLEIPVCTLKMFPEEAVHCIEWARDKFEKLFSQHPKSLQKFADNPEFVPQTPQDIKTLKDSLRLLNKKPSNFSDCVKHARMKFQKYFVNDIRQLMFVYPPDAKGKEGHLFWTLPKRPPHERKFDPKNPLHADFIMAVASLFAKVWGVPVPDNVRTEEGKLKYAKMAAEIPVTEYIPNAKKAKEIASEVEKDEKAAPEENKGLPVAAPELEDEDDKLPQDQLINKLLDDLDAKLSEMASANLTISPEDFEKDNDLNFHIDFIYAMANCRAECYGIEGLSWMNTKLKAGRIIPALASTTAVVAALQTLELVKLLKGMDVVHHRNAFVNLALPYLSLSEPGPAKQVQLTPELKVTLWDRWDVKPANGYGTKFADLLELLKNTYKLEPRDVFKGNKPIYMHTVMMTPGKSNEKAKIMNSKLEDALDMVGSESYVDLTITFCKAGEEKLLDGVPTVRVIFK